MLVAVQVSVQRLGQMHGLDIFTSCQISDRPR
jgi:hypothetical protein